MNNSAITPEEKLLLLIKPAKKSFKAAASLTQSEAAPQTAPYRKRTSNFKKYYLLCKPFITMAVCQKLALLALAVSIVFFVFSLLYPVFGMKNIPLPKVAEQAAALENYDKWPAARPLEYYLQSVKQRQIFNTPTEEIEATIIAAESDRVKDFTLVGIIADSEPQAVLEDKKSHELHYVKQGQSVGEMKILSVEERKIIIQYRGGRYEFSL